MTLAVRGNALLPLGAPTTSLAVILRNRALGALHRVNENLLVVVVKDLLFIKCRTTGQSCRTLLLPGAQQWNRIQAGEAPLGDLALRPLPPSRHLPRLQTIRLPERDPRAQPLLAMNKWSLRGGSVTGWVATGPWLNAGSLILA